MGTFGFDLLTSSALYCVFELQLLFSSLFCVQVSASQPLQRVRSNLLTRTYESRASRRPSRPCSRSKICPRLFSLTARNVVSRQNSRFGMVSLLFCPLLLLLLQGLVPPILQCPWRSIVEHVVARCQDLNRGGQSRCGNGSVGRRLASRLCS